MKSKLIVAIAGVLCVPLIGRGALPMLTNATLVWNPSSEAASYTLYWGTDPANFSESNSCPSTQTNLYVANLLLNQFYYFSITATDSAGTESAFGEPLARAWPPAHVKVVASASGNGMMVSWDPVAGAANYTVTASPVADVQAFITNLPSSQTQVTLAALAGTGYEVSVVATDPAGNQSIASAAVPFTPGPASSLNIACDGNLIVLTWDDPASLHTLQAGSEINGPFSEIPGATSPYTMEISGTQQFFRLGQ